jgi:hypothetical protein
MINAFTSNQILLSVVYVKTRSGGKTAPEHCISEEDLLTQVDKTPEPLPHPYTAAP